MAKDLQQRLDALRWDAAAAQRETARVAGALAEVSLERDVAVGACSQVSSRLLFLAAFATVAALSCAGRGISGAGCGGRGGIAVAAFATVAAPSCEIQNT